MEIKFIGGTKMRFDKGVGFCDPCYFTKLGKDKQWRKFCDELWRGTDMHGRGKAGIFEIDGVRILVMPTAYGDGSYDVNCDLSVRGNTCGVDAGLLCAFPLEHMDKLTDDTIGKFATSNVLGQVVEDFGGEIEIDLVNYAFKGDHGLSLETGDVETDEE